MRPILIAFPLAFFVATFLCDLAFWGRVGKSAQQCIRFPIDHHFAPWPERRDLITR